MSDSFIGRQLGKYRIEQVIGRGGMGHVYRAVDTMLQRQVALKVLAPSLGADPDFARRFEREAITAANLRHPAIITIFDVGEVDGLHYIAMEYIAGRPLSDVLEEHGQLGLAYTIAIIAPIAEALDFAHSHGMVHRDVKPQNILLDVDGRVLLTDFGIAIGPQEGGERITRTGTFIGTPEYISPEQAQAQPLTGHSDIYSLGIVTYELLIGRVPFEGSIAQQLIAHIYQPPPPISTLDPASPPELDEILARALAKAPDQRFERADELVEALRAVAHQYGMPEASREEIAALAVAANSSAGRATVALRHGSLQPQEPSQHPTPVGPFPMVAAAGAAPQALSGASAATSHDRQPAAAPPFALGGNNSSVPPRYPPRHHEEEGGSYLPWAILAFGAVGLALIALLIVQTRGAADLLGLNPTPMVNSPVTTTETPTPDPLVFTPEPSPTFLPGKPTPTEEHVPTDTPTPSPTDTPTPEPTATATPEPTNTSTPEPTATNTPTPEPTATPTPLPTDTPTREPTATNTPTPEPTNTPTPEPTATATPEPTATSTSIWTPIGDSDTVAYIRNTSLLLIDQTSGESSLRIDNVDPAGPPALQDNRLLFAASDSDNSPRQIMRVDSDGSNLKRLTKQHDNFHPSWGPNDMIVFASRRNANTDIYVMNSNGGKQQQLTNNPAADQYPSFSPDGERIVFESDRDDGSWGIFTTDLQASPPDRLIPAALTPAKQPAADRLPRWSPDGKQIVFVSNRDRADGGFDIYLFDIAAQQTQRLTTFETGSLYGPTWSPDGTLIAGYGSTDGDNDLYIIDVATGEVQKDPNATDADERWPVWGK